MKQETIDKIILAGFLIAAGVALGALLVISNLHTVNTGIRQAEWSEVPDNLKK